QCVERHTPVCVTGEGQLRSAARQGLVADLVARARQAGRTAHDDLLRWFVIRDLSVLPTYAAAGRLDVGAATPRLSDDAACRYADCSCLVEGVRFRNERSRDR